MNIIKTAIWNIKVRYRAVTLSLIVNITLWSFTLLLLICFEALSYNIALILSLPGYGLYLFFTALIQATLYINVATIFLLGYLARKLIFARKKEISLQLISGVSYKFVYSVLLVEYFFQYIITVIFTIAFSKLFFKALSFIFIKAVEYGIELPFVVGDISLSSIAVRLAVYYLILALYNIRVVSKMNLEKSFRQEKPHIPKVTKNIVPVIITLFLSVFVMFQTIAVLETNSINGLLDILFLVVFGICSVYFFVDSFITCFTLFIPKRIYLNNFNMVVYSKMNQMLISNIKTTVLTIVLLVTSFGLITGANALASTVDSTLQEDEFTFSYYTDSFNPFEIAEQEMQSILKVIHENGGTVSKMSNYTITDYDRSMYLVGNVYSESDFNNYLLDKGKEQFDLVDDFAAIAPDGYESHIEQVSISGVDYKISQIYYQNGDIYYIISDELLESIQANSSLDISSREEYIANVSPELVRDVLTQIKELAIVDIDICDRYTQYNLFFLMKQVITVISLILALILIIIVITIYAVKILFDANEFKPEYNKLVELGISEREIRSLISRQTNMYLLFPLVISIIIWKFLFEFTLLQLSYSFDFQEVYKYAYGTIALISMLYILYASLIKRQYYKIITAK